jgi:hypothetical protein
MSEETPTGEVPVVLEEQVLTDPLAVLAKFQSKFNDLLQKYHNALE